MLEAISVEASFEVVAGTRGAAGAGAGAVAVAGAVA